MRDPARMNKVLHALSYIWQRQPDTRFNQLIHNLQWEYSSTRAYDYHEILWEEDVHNGIRSYRQKKVIDLFNVEDDDFIKFLEVKVARLKFEEE